MMSETISDKIMNGEWIEGETVEFECPDGVMRSFYCGGTGYGQSCGGWEHTETGQMFAVANWSNRSWKSTTTSYVTVSDLLNKTKKVNEDGNWDMVYAHTTQSKLIHPYSEQMLWYFNAKDIDINKLVAIKFTWRHNVGSSYNLEAGPQRLKQVSEPIPACIPRGMFYGVTDKEYLGNWIHGHDELTHTEQRIMPSSNYEITHGGN
tara:strand:- start:402 stop:1019 length:618 start_codon:yes stop_codon:yes gene_type:complete